MSLTKTVNIYLSMLIIAIVGAGASAIIIHVVNSDALVATVGGSALNYLPI